MHRPHHRFGCPHCSNRDPNTLQSNGETSNSPDLTVLCVNPVKPSEWSFDAPPEPDMINANGLVPCGMQWDPNQ